MIVTSRNSKQHPTRGSAHGADRTDLAGFGTIHTQSSLPVCYYCELRCIRARDTHKHTHTQGIVITKKKRRRNYSTRAMYTDSKTIMQCSLSNLPSILCQYRAATMSMYASCLLGSRLQRQQRAFAKWGWHPCTSVHARMNFQHNTDSSCGTCTMIPIVVTGPQQPNISAKASHVW